MDRLSRTAMVFAVFSLANACFADGASPEAHVSVASVQAPPGGWREGVHYLTLPSAASHVPAGKVGLIEVFSYSCSGCYKFEPYLVQWRATLSDHVDFTRIPAVWTAEARAYARLYYTLQTLRRNDLDTAIF